MLPLALDSGWAALGGALIGSVAGGAVTAALSWLQRRQLVKAGARLVAAEIEMADSVLADFQAWGAWRDFYKLGMRAWNEYREVLATHLDQERMEAVVQAVTNAAMVHDHPPVLEYKGDWNRWASELREEMRVGYNALAKEGGHKTYSETEWLKRLKWLPDQQRFAET